jgi:ubiquinone/menaquinone biosynthesis C-methylase UbiE
MAYHDVERFNARAPSYDASWVQRVFAPVHKATLELAASLNPRPREVLDVGCGTGALLARAASRFPEAELVGVDPADQMIELARTRAPAGSRARFICASASRLPFDDDTFDLAVSTMSFGFWPHSAGMREIRRILAPRGRLVLADMFGVGWLKRLIPAVGRRYPMLAAHEVEQLLDSAGLTLSRWQPVLRAGPVPLLWAVAASKSAYQPRLREPPPTRFR